MAGLAAPGVLLWAQEDVGSGGGQAAMLGLKRREKLLRIHLPKRRLNSSLEQSLARPLKSP